MYEKRHTAELERRVLDLAAALFVDERRLLVHRLCISLQYVNAADLARMGSDPVTLDLDPTELFVALKGVTGCLRRYDALFDVSNACDKYRMNFFSNVLHNARNREQMLDVLQKAARTEESEVERRLLEGLSVAVGNLYDNHTFEHLNVENEALWQALRGAWCEGSYWLSTEELELIMALTETPVAIYL